MSPYFHFVSCFCVFVPDVVETGKQNENKMVFFIIVCENRKMEMQEKTFFQSKQAQSAYKL